MTERWLPIKGFPDYEISDYSRVRSYKRGTVKYLSPCPFRRYLGIYLFVDGKKHVKYIHKLVAQAFLGDADGLIVCHRDGDIFNNNLDNLVYGTQLDNMADAKRHGTTACGTRLPQSKLNERKVKVIRGLREIGFTVPRLSQMFGVSLRSIYRVIRRETWAFVD